ncbi:MAG: MBL fold metallo-hydrolase [Coriobacteriia bacterium]|nr:MBL fold metallo-hydrolase [Coriobacteriia bacterium]
MEVVRVQVGALEVNCWIVSDGQGGPAVIIDPGDDPDAIMRALEGRKVRAIVLTHGHFDHMNALCEVAKRTGAPFYLHAKDAERLVPADGLGPQGALAGSPALPRERTRTRSFGPQDIFGRLSAALPDAALLEDGDEIIAGRLMMQVLHTPGHTPGGIALLVADPKTGASHLFSGDTLFAGSVGRTDFPGGDPATLTRAIAEKIAPLSPDTVVHPGHGPGTTIALESARNPFWPRA